MQVGNFNATLPIVLHAQDDATSTTRSAISDANIVITDATPQREDVYMKG